MGYIWLFVNFLFFIFDNQGRTRVDYFAGTIVGKKIDDEILKRKADLATMSIPSTTVNGINNRSELLNSLKS